MQANELGERAPHVRKTADAAQKFEAFVLQSFIQEMMPETQESVFGSGVSGDFWKSMMAEKIAEQVAERGNLGIADMIRAGHLAPVKPQGFNPLDVMRSDVLSGGVASQLDTKPVLGE
ncbi:rod-binding protein [Hyphomicrobium sp. CS1GBMeth3]|uniref:rod-binding protein n=1 Tax=Hyphomicrobium sp. CS1GBMeth3 TaxID=1892845 RepID=UPI0015C56239|nr:rod-binding protein [Hyphomicrobium sp. CS1GBMeth3]